MVIQSDRFASSLTTVAMTSTSAGQAIYRVDIELLGTRTRILTDQIFSLDDSRFGEFVGSLSGDELDELDRALLLKSGLL